MRIGIDCRLCGPAHAGIGRYILQLIHHLYLLHPEVEWILFFATDTQKQLLSRSCPQAKLIKAPIRHYTLQEQLKLPRLFSQQHLDVLHVPHFNAPLCYRGKMVLTIHDLLWHEYRGAHVTTLSPAMYWLKYVMYRLVVRTAISKANHIVVPSETVKQILINLFPKTQAKTSVTPEAVSLPSQAQPVHNLPSQYWLYVGSLYPHKNVQVILHALQAQPNISLVIVSSRSVFSDQTSQLAQELGVDSQVILLHQISDAELLYVYQHATVLLQPSLSEGFGLTGLEAMEAKCPVVCSDIPIFHEIYGAAAKYFDPHQAADLLQSIHLATQDSARLKQLGTKQSQKYTWKNTAQATWQVYQDLIAVSSSHV